MKLPIHNQWLGNMTILLSLPYEKPWNFLLELSTTSAKIWLNPIDDKITAGVSNCPESE
jgi:hypothetical protein